MSDHRCCRKAFTLLELLVVIAVIGVLLSVLMPSLSSARDASKLVSCVSNQRQVSVAILLYAGSNNGRLPPWNVGRLAIPIGTPGGTTGGPFAPGYEDSADPPWSQLLVDGGFLPPKCGAFKCPADHGLTGEISYTMNVCVAAQVLSAINNPAEKILITERYDPPNNNRPISSYSYAGASSSHGINCAHVGKAAFVFVDGHGQVLPWSTTDPKNIQPPVTSWQLP